ncbi:RNA polymerase, sigma-24 subunit, ECF subfamily [Niastella koreensis GR20-10]|uniref:RNA polymerase, sigma-24 subunit, ECF subfamily n=1 Tax=Niastella koreensis (strain DSM 17620 / KACC 11465 / NBRC 106392 / GR20-10) TaxID=700598 RepID=G8T6X6_NIAKG|nr:sigma-70 family RNA polymerase sigma factor [Niastella koreensis]AEV98997.1 RNA polymerase, sigma-24 subunit, ECF subfamily [Niastella koreensis GR20-10]
MKYVDFTSEELWIQFLPGDHLALDAIVKRHYNLLYQYGCKFTRDAALVKDCIQDLFLYLWHKRNAINETASVEHYLMKALRRRLGKALTKSGSTEGLSFIEFKDANATPDDQLIQQEQRAALADRIRKCILQLSKRQQEIIYLRFYLNASAAEIADIMQLNRQSVYNLLNDALNKLRRHTGAYFKPTIALSIVLILVLSQLWISDLAI